MGHTPQRTARPRFTSAVRRAARPLPRLGRRRELDARVPGARATAPAPGDDRAEEERRPGRRASPPARSCRSRTGSRPRGSSPPARRRRRTVSRLVRRAAARARSRAGAPSPRAAAAGPPWVVTIRWASAGTASAFTSSGSAWSRSCATARACAHRTSATEERGDAPSATSGAERVAVTSSTAYGRRRRPRRRSGRPPAARRTSSATAPARARRAGGRRAAASRRRRRCPGRGSRPGPTWRTGRAGPRGAGRCRGARSGSPWRPEEGLGQRARDAVDGDLALLHRLEQRRLGAGRGPVDLVDQDDVGEDGPGTNRNSRRAWS